MGHGPESWGWGPELGRQGWGGGLRSGQEALENPWQLISEPDPGSWLLFVLVTEPANTTILSRNPGVAAYTELYPVPHSALIQRKARLVQSRQHSLLDQKQT